jgi:integrase
MSGNVELWKHPATGRWYVTWTVGRRSHRRTTGTRDRGEAEAFRAAFVLNGGAQPVETSEARIDAVLDSYYNRHAKHLPSAVQAVIAIRSLKAFYGVSTVAAITARNHERFIAERTSQGKSNGTINRHLGTLRAALRFAVRSGDLSNAPHVPGLREPPSRANVLDRRQVAALLRAARALGHGHVALFIRLAVYTGARRRAILDLTWDRVDLKAGTVDFRLPGVIHARKRRAVTALPARLVSSLRRLRKRAKSSHVIEWNGKPVASIKRSFRDTAKAAKLAHITPHILKHTAVSWALRVASLWVVSGMTATSVRTLQNVYGKHLVEDQRAAVEAMARNPRANPPKKKATTRRKNAKKSRRK